MVPLSEIFNVWYGVNLEVVNSEVVSLGIPFVSRQSVNNGVVCHVKKVDEIKPNPAHTLSIAVSGSVLSTFYHDYEYYSGRDIYIAQPKITLTKAEMLYYCYIIEQNKFRYNYGRGANKTFRDILVPSYTEIPSYVKNKKNFQIFKSTSVLKCRMFLASSAWRWFELGKLFPIIYKAVAHNAQDLIVASSSLKGSIPHVTRTDVNNGVKDFVQEESDFKKENGNAISIGDTTATIFYQEQEFICGDHMVILRSPKLNKYNGLFLTTIINLERPRYNYGRAFKKDTIAATKIKLPAINTGEKDESGKPIYEPDWQFMEDYIKSLPYSACL